MKSAASIPSLNHDISRLIGIADAVDNLQQLCKTYEFQSLAPVTNTFLYVFGLMGNY